jgi:hypothetical protein
MMSPTEMALGNRSNRGATKRATRISFRLKPHRPTILAMPNRKTFSALPVEKPPPMKEADMVAKMTSGPYERATTA